MKKYIVLALVALLALVSGCMSSIPSPTSIPTPDTTPPELMSITAYLNDGTEKSLEKEGTKWTLQLAKGDTVSYAEAVVSEPVKLVEGANPVITMSGESFQDVVHSTITVDSQNPTKLRIIPNPDYATANVAGTFTLTMASGVIEDYAGNRNTKVNLTLIVKEMPTPTPGPIPTPVTPPTPTSTLSQEELNQIKQYGYDKEHLVRWPYGNIYVYDYTGFPKLQTVFDKWNEVLEGKANLVLTNDLRKAQVKVMIDNSISSQCGWASVTWEDFKIVSGEVKVTDYCFSDLAVYLHEFGHILGIGKHTSTGIMAPIATGSEIDPFAAKLMQNIYSLPIGFNLP